MQLDREEIMDIVTETAIPLAVVFGIPLAVAAYRPTRGTLVLLLAVGATFVNVMLARDDLHPTQWDDLAWAAIVNGVMAVLVVTGWLAGRSVHRRVQLGRPRAA